MIEDWFKTKYKHYANEYKQRIVDKVVNKKNKINTILCPYVKEKGVCKIITDYLPYKRNDRHYHFEKIDTWDENERATDFYQKRTLLKQNQVGYLLISLVLSVQHDIFR